MTIMDPRGAFPPLSGLGPDTATVLCVGCAQAYVIVPATKCDDCKRCMPDDGKCWRFNLPDETERPFCDLPQEHLGFCQVSDESWNGLPDGVRMAASYLREYSEKSERKE